MRRRAPSRPLLLILLLLPTPALCAICTAAGCEMEQVAEGCPMEQAPDDCCDEESGTAHGSHGPAMADPMPMGQDEMPAGHDCASQAPTAAAADCCVATAGLDAETPAAAAPTSHGLTPVVQPSLSVAPDLASDADGPRQALLPAAAPRALYTLHSTLLI